MKFFAFKFSPRAALTAILIAFTHCLPLGSLTASAPSPTAQKEHPAPERRVVVVANSALPDSERIARVYMAHRNIPDSHLIRIQAPTAETLSRQQFIESVYNPILRALQEQELISALPVRADELGRDAVTLLQTDLRYMVLCHGIPLRVRKVRPEDDIDVTLFLRQRFTGGDSAWIERFTEGPMAKDEASVDGELALLLQRNVPLNGFVPNPFFRNTNPGASNDVLKVTRLDGPSPEAVLRSLRNAWRGEELGLRGRAYVDEDGRGGGFAQGNEWLKVTADLFRQLNFDLSHDTERTTFPVDSRFDAPVLYAGWYARHVNEPFTLPGFHFPPGAIATHLHSYSASSVRSTDRDWVGPLVARGVSATLGNVFEPYLSLTHHFHFFFMALANGWNFADAAYFALPGLSWQAVAVGDPLFRPFAVDLPTQLAAVGPMESSHLDQYVQIRAINRMVQQEQPAEAAEFARMAMLSTPGIALALRHAQLLIEQSEPAAAVRALAVARNLTPDISQDLGLFAEVADTLTTLREHRDALNLYRKILSQDMPDNARIAFLTRAIPVAQNARETEIAINWQTQLNRLNPQP